MQYTQQLGTYGMYDMKTNRLSIAKQFAAEKMQERDDVVAVLVSGSTARGDALPVSDIDLRFVCQIPVDQRMNREGWCLP